MKVRARLGRWIALGTALGLALVWGGFSIAEAVIPAPGGIVKACYKKNGNLRVLDSAASCKVGKETAIQWNQTGAPGAPGAAGAPGAPGPTGPSGVVATHVFAGWAGSAIAAGASAYSFVGPDALFSISAGQRLTGSASAVLGATTGTATFDFGLCWQSGTGGNVLPMAGGNFQTAQADALLRPFATAYSTEPGITGTVRVGFCVKNHGAIALDANDFVNGFVQVTN